MTAAVGSAVGADGVARRRCGAGIARAPQGGRGTVGSVAGVDGFEPARDLAGRRCGDGARGRVGAWV